MKSIFKTQLIFALLLASAVAGAQCVANFTYSQGSNGQVIFTSTSTGTTANTSYYWWSSDGTPNSATSTFTCNFPDNQVYIVQLQIIDSSATPHCSGISNQNVSVTSAPCSQTLNLSALLGWNYNANLIVNSTFPISGGYSFTWDYGDGTTSTGAAPSSAHTYSNAGTYNASVSATSNGGTCTYSASAPITVSLITCPLNAGFTHSAGNGNGLVNFSSTSTGTSSSTHYKWNYGDGHIDYYAGPTTSHQYMANGNFTAILTIADSANSWGLVCFDTIIQNISVSNFTCLANSSFILHKDSSQAFHWFIYPSYPPNVSAASWNWGDGSSTNGLYPSHTFSAAGMYNICLSVTVSCGATYSTCVNSSIFKGSGQMVGVTVVDPLGATGIKEQATSLLGAVISPNPNSGRFKISGDGFGSSTRVEIYNNLGQLLLDRDLQSEAGQMEIDASELAPGAYFLRIESGGRSKTCRMILTRD